MYTDKKVLKVLLFYAISTTIISFIIELLFKNYLFNYTLSLIIGIIISMLNFFILGITVNKVTNNNSKVKFWVISSYILRLLICALCMYLIFISPFHYGIFTCFFGFLSIRICIFINYNIIEKIKDEKRKIDELKINDNIKQELKNNQIYTSKQLCTHSKEDLLKFLSEEDINSIINALKEYELFIRGELEVIKDNDDSD